jgi:tetratricopeptide (TPR) repeat protein
MSLNQKIHEHIKQREFLVADNLIKSKINEEPNSAEGYYLKGVSEYFQGRIGTAIDHLKIALDKDPKHTDAAICLSVLYNDIGKYDLAKQVFERANQSVVHRPGGETSGIDKKFSVKHLELGDLYFRYRRYDEAIDEYSKAMVLDPTDLDIRIRRAKTFAKKGFSTRATQELEQLVSEAPKYIPARIQLGLLHFSQGNQLEAELEWEEVLKQSPGNREVLSYLKRATNS